MGDIEQILQTSWPILLMVVIFYFLLWRPQKKQQKERTNLLSSLKKGQKIVTIGGIYGEIIELDDEKVKVQVAEKVEMTFARTAIASVVSKKNASPSALLYLLQIVNLGHLSCVTRLFNYLSMNRHNRLWPT